MKLPEGNLVITVAVFNSKVNSVSKKKVIITYYHASFQPIVNKSNLVPLKRQTKPTFLLMVTQFSVIKEEA